MNSRTPSALRLAGRPLFSWQATALAWTLSLALGSAPSPLHAQVQPRIVVNEILYWPLPSAADPRRTHEWIELYNADTAAVALNGWLLSDRDGATGPTTRTLPNVVFPPGAYLVVHIATGTNDLDFSDGCGEYYTGDPQGRDLFDNASDDCALYSDARGGSDTVVDYVAWGSRTVGYQPGLAHREAVAALRWTNGDFVETVVMAHSPNEMVRIVRPGTSIGRDKDGTDTDLSRDWDADGGRDALDITPCARNFTPLTFVGDTTPPRPAREWTIMLYLAADANVERFAFDWVLEQIEAALVENTSVYIVTLFDGRNHVEQIGRPETRGGTWRFELGPDRQAGVVRMRSPAGMDPFLGSPAGPRPDVNTADPAALADFVSWAKLNYPARKYGLVLWGHGRGWKGVCTDDTSSIGGWDALFMGELGSALHGADLDLIAFNSCMMAAVDVAWQVEPAAKVMVASEEIMLAAGFDYPALVRRLLTNPAIDGAALGQGIVADYSARYRAGPLAFPLYTLSCVDLAKLKPVVDVVSNAATELSNGCTDFRAHEDPSDNVQMSVARDRAASEWMVLETNFRDLGHLFARIRDDGAIPGCYKAAVTQLPGVLQPAILANVAGDLHPDATGLTIYFPRDRSKMQVAPQTWLEALLWVDPYDFPSVSRVTTSNSRRAMYAPNPDCLPMQAVDIETGAALTAPRQWPLVPAPAFRFPEDTFWDEFLVCYYKPAADAHILYAREPGGRLVYPTIDYPPCGNPVDRISVVPGSTVYFSAVGSSDPDTSPMHWMWDFRDLFDSCPPDCRKPWTVDAGHPPSEASDDMDVDCNPTPTDDEREADAVTTSFTFDQNGTFVVNLSVWDDDYKYPARTSQPPTPCLPSALRTHINVSSHSCTVEVAECNLLVGLAPVQYCIGNDCLLVNPIISPSVTLQTVPTWPIPNDPNLLHVHLYAQVFMNNPGRYPLDPIRMSNGLDIELGVGTARYGPGSGIDLWARQRPLLGGTLDLMFSIQ